MDQNKQKSESSFRLLRLVLSTWKDVRDWFARALDVNEDRKAVIYIDLAKAATLKDILYWLQIFFSAGIATLGLVQNSSAVIIGAMLISPLMGPILASGLALATGDLILAVRALASLALSTIGAILFAVILVTFLPFKEGTAEITSRISPNTLDLMIALFSGAVGSVAICREVRGVVTSIPGVAIAVALMPPLCVVGYGVGLSLSLSFSDGWKFAAGGGLLYLTNLVAIIFTAMLAFIMLRIDTPKVREKVREWRETDIESLWWQNAITKIPSLEKARQIRSMSLRLLMILLPLLLIFIPLSQSYSKLKNQIQQQQSENKIQQMARKVWDDFLTNNINHKASQLDQLKVNEKEDKLEVIIRIFDNVPFTQEERDKYKTTLARELNRRDESVTLKLIEIPTSERFISQPQTEEKAPPPSIVEQQANFLQSVKNSLAGLKLPAGASLLDYKIINSPNNTGVQISYIGSREIDADARELIADEVKGRLIMPNSSVSFEFIPIEPKDITFANNQTQLTNGDINPLDMVGKDLQNHEFLKLEVALKPNKNGNENLIAERQQAIKDYLAQTWKIDEVRIVFTEATGENPKDSVRIITTE